MFERFEYWKFIIEFSWKVFKLFRIKRRDENIFLKFIWTRWRTEEEVISSFKYFHDKYIKNDLFYDIIEINKIMKRSFHYKWDIKHSIEESLFTLFYSYQFWSLSKNKKHEIIELWFLEFEQNKRKINSFLDIKEDIHLTFYLNNFYNNKKEIIKNFDDYLFSKEYWLNFWNLKSYNKNKLLEFWFFNFQQLIKNKSFLKNESLIFSLENKNINIKEYEIILEERKFKNHFWSKFFNCSEIHKSKLISFWFNNILKLLKEFKELKEIQFNDIIEFDLLKLDLKREELTRFLDYKYFSSIFWQQFVQTNNDKIKKTLDLWKIEFLKRIKEFNRKIKKETFQVIYEIVILWKSNKDYLNYIEYQKFYEEYWIEFSNWWKRNKEKLIEIWFKKFKKELKNKDWLNWHNLSDIIKNDLLSMNINEYQIYINSKNFSNFYWLEFWSLRKEYKDYLIQIWFEEFRKLINQKSYLKNERLIDIIEHDFLNIEKDDFLYFKEKRKFDLEFWRNFIFLTIEKKDKLIRFWIENFKKEIKNKKYLNEYSFSFQVENFDLTKEEFYQKIQNVKSKQFSNKEKELFEFIKSIYNWKIEENIKWIFKNQTRKEIDIFLEELNLWFEFNWVYWHNYDYWTSQKIKIWKEYWIRIINIFEHEFDLFKDQIQNIIKYEINKKESNNLKISWNKILFNWIDVDYSLNNQILFLKNDYIHSLNKEDIELLKNNFNIKELRMIVRWDLINIDNFLKLWFEIMNHYDVYTITSYDFKKFEIGKLNNQIKYKKEKLILFWSDLYEIRFLV